MQVRAGEHLAQRAADLDDVAQFQFQSVAGRGDAGRQGAGVVDGRARLGQLGRVEQRAERQVAGDVEPEALDLGEQPLAGAGLVY